MSYTIRKLEVGGVLDQGIQLAKNHFRVLLTIVAIVFLPAALVSNLIQVSMMPPQPGNNATPEELQQFAQEVFQVLPWMLIPGLFIAFLVIPVTNAAVLHAVARFYLGQSVSPGESISAAFSRLLPLIGTSILTGLAVFAGMLLCFVPGFIFMLWFFLATHIVVLEGTSGPAAMSRSKQLLQGNMLSLFALLLIVGLINGMVGMLSSLIPQIHFQVILQIVVQAGLTIFSTAIFVVFYFSCRCGHENFDLEHLAEAMGEDVKPADQNPYAEDF